MPSSATRRFFGGGGGGGRERENSQQSHRVPHPKGPRDLEAQESEALVSGGEDGQHRRNESASTESSDDEGGARLGRIDTYDSQTAL
jgi:hypothetical protein